MFLNFERLGSAQLREKQILFGKLESSQLSAKCRDKCSSSNGISNSSATWYVHRFFISFCNDFDHYLISKTKLFVMLESGLTNVLFGVEIL